MVLRYEKQERMLVKMVETLVEHPDSESERDGPLYSIVRRRQGRSQIPGSSVGLSRLS